MLNGSVKIEFDQIPQNQVLLTFANDRSNKNALIDHINCWSALTNSIVIENALENETKMFCLMDKQAKTISPFDCLSILPRNNYSGSDSVWLTEDDKVLAIGLLVMGLLIFLCFGFGIGVFIVKRKLNAKNNRKQSTLSRPDSMTPDWKHDKRNGLSYPYTDNDTASIASGKSYVTAVNPSRFDLIKMRLEKAENPYCVENEIQYDLEDMPYSKV